ncbi:MAG: PepSY-associated TM helix domain-containing protein [Novosphingobium sp.]|nr:PepSY domain-containing protein [Novosphingobium sp.]
MNRPISKEAVKRALSAHAAIGLLASALLYLVCLTGTLVVFFEEWQRIEQPAAPEMAVIPPEAVQSAVETVLASEKGKPATRHLYVHLPTEALPRATITTDHQAVHLDADGAVIMPEEIAWSDFLLALHYRLNMPAIVGMTIVGALGAMIVALAISGVIAHPRIFRDAFRLRARDRGGIALSDWHNRLSVWTLPFSVAVALTGALIGLASFTGYGMASGFYGGDVEAVYAPVFGGEPEIAGGDAGVPDVVPALQMMERDFPRAIPYYVTLHEPLTAQQHVQIVAEHPNRLIFGEYYNFDAAGRYLGKAGLADGQLGQQLAASTYNLHFGNYGGLAVKFAYFAFGLALCAIIATGVYIWLAKRRRRGIDNPRIRNVWDGVVWGMPLALTVTFLVRLTVGNDAPLMPVFWCATALILVAAMALAPRWKVRAPLQILLIAGVIACCAWLAAI